MSVLVQVLDLSVASSSATFFCAAPPCACSRRSATRATIMCPSVPHPRLAAGVNRSTTGARQRAAKQKRDVFIAISTAPNAWSRIGTPCYHRRGHGVGRVEFFREVGVGKGAEDRSVHFRSDGLALSPAEYAHLLTRVARNDGIAPDEFSRGGVVARLEERIAALLGKEMALFLPSGTMANHLALRVLAQRGRRVLVQRESHIHNDSGDCAQELSGLTLI